jgi:hypothetical protein
LGKGLGLRGVDANRAVSADEVGTARCASLIGKTRCGTLHNEEKEDHSAMIQTVEAVIEKDGSVRLLQRVTLPRTRRALVTILEEDPISPNETALLSEAALAEDWNRPEEDAAWSHLQSGK